MEMSLLQDLLKELPLSSALRERVELAEEAYERASQEVESCRQRIAALERENETLRARLPSEPAGELGDDTVRVLVHLFRAEELENRDAAIMARDLEMERGVLQYHLDRLKDVGLSSVMDVYWSLTREGRRYIVERKLI
jgi:hypothetical protein